MAAVWVAVAAILAVSGGAAVAAPVSPVAAGARHTVTFTAPDDTVIVCVVSSSPVPQYSSSGGTYGTVHYGAHMSCDTSGALVVTTELFEQQVNHPGSPLTLEDTRYLRGAGTSIGGSWYHACLTDTQMAWVTYIYASWNGIDAQPSPLSSGNQILNCE
jgi:hypothetical protein